VPAAHDAPGSPSAHAAPETPVVSVIMIFLDAQRFIVEAIDSVLAQTYPAWELILVDDGSSDDSTRIARGHAELRPGQVRYVEHEGHRNLGMSASRNAGIAASRGELIAFLNADDVYRPEKLARQVAILERRPRAAMVYGASQYWHSWTGEPGDLALDRPRRLGVAPDTLVEPPALIALYLSGEARTAAMCALLVRRGAVEQVGGFEDSFSGMFEDQVFLFKLCLRHAVFVESGSWDRYRQHPESFVERERRSGNDIRRESTPEQRAFLEWLERHLAEQGIADADLRAALRRATRPYRHPLAHRLSPRRGVRRLLGLRRRLTA